MRDNKIWIFNATNDFNGNVKYLFLYINKYHPEIKAVWMSDSVSVTQKIRKLGYEAYLYKSLKADYYKENASVFVVHQAKEHFPVAFNNEVKILNLWHGVGLKPIERYVDSAGIKERTYRKYIKFNQIYRNNQMFLVTSPFMEEHFQKYLGLEDDQIVRGAYPVNQLNTEFKVNENTIETDKTIVLYAPTFRDYNINGSFSSAFPEIEKLLAVAEEKNLLIIFKLHYLTTNDNYFNIVKEKYGDSEYLMFWEDEDIYEIFDQIDVAIVDYSSIYYDLILSDTKVIRYIYDYEDYMNGRPLVYDYYENTSGKIAKDYDQLLEALSNYEQIESSENDAIIEKFWSYGKDYDFSSIVETVENFKIKDKVHPTLYSFDIFDTILQRKTLSHTGIYFGVAERAKRSDLNFPRYITENYPRVRTQSESQVREYYKKSHEFRKSDKREVQLSEIIESIQQLYDLTQEQADFLFNTEIDLEIIGAEPKHDLLDILLELRANGEEVVLISDMYLPEFAIRKMLDNVHPSLRDVKLFLSSTYGYQKTTKLLYMQVFEELDYNYDKWVHYGDNHLADIKMASQMGIEAIHHKRTDYNAYERSFFNRAHTYDSSKVATLFARFREQNDSLTDYYSYAYVSAYFVPYLHWTIKNALADGLDTLYFISRDGHTLKYIADSIIEVHGYDIKTKYIYGSRKAWRIPSFINEIDEEFYAPYGNLQGISDFPALLRALTMEEEDLARIFPILMNLKDKDHFDDSTKEFIKSVVRESKEYEQYLLAYAKDKREILDKYLVQEIDLNEKFAFVEYWGRGYTQTCLDRLLNNIKPNTDTIFYYARSIYPTHGSSIRRNFTARQTSLIFVETIFNNIPYQSITSYEYDVDGKVAPVFEAKEYNHELAVSMETYIPQFVRDLYAQEYFDLNEVEHDLFDFGVDYFRAKPLDAVIISEFSNLKDSVILYEPEVEYAPAITVGEIAKSVVSPKHQIKTKNVRMSVKKSSKPVKIAFNVYNRHSKKIKRMTNGSVKQKVKNQIKKRI